MSKHRHTTRRTNLEAIKGYYIHPRITVQEFLGCINEDPYSIDYDFDVRYALELLREKAKEGTQTESQKARHILKEAKLEAFIPKGSEHNKPKDFIWNFYKRHPEILFEYIEQLKSKMLPSYVNVVNASENRKETIRICFARLLNGDPNPELVEEIHEKCGMDKSNLDLTRIAFAFFSVVTGIGYSTVHRFYYTDAKDKRREWEREKKEERVHDSPIPRKKGTPLSAIIKTHNPNLTAKQIWEKPQAAFETYQRAYSWYALSLRRFRFPFLCPPNEHAKYIKDNKSS